MIKLVFLVCLFLFIVVFYTVRNYESIKKKYYNVHFYFPMGFTTILHILDCRSIGRMVFGEIEMTQRRLIRNQPY